jgi:hypothetical protein
VGWYQGESNGGDSTYGQKLTDMIAEWRGDWGLPNLPFGIVQLPSTKWSAARDGEFDVSQNVANTFLVATLDLPGSSQLHPTTKKPIGIRMGIGARGLVYGDNLTISGPVGDGPTTFTQGSKVIVKFDYLGNGLATTGGGAPTGFQVAAASGNFSSATATIVGTTVELTSSIATPARVRYSWSTNGNLVNQVSIPVEGGAATVTSLPSPQFDLTIGGSGGGGGGTQTHVASITVVQTGNGPNKRAQATITVQDENGQPVPNATVAGDFTGTFNEPGRTGTTNSSGVATITSNGKTGGTVTATFCVTNITHASMSYNPAANVETCDSN